MEELDLDIAGEYIYEAAILIQLKSRMLLPAAPVEEGDEPEDGSARSSRGTTARGISESKKSPRRSRRSLLFGAGSGHASGRSPKENSDDDEELELGDLSLFDLLKTFKRVLDRFDREHPEPLHLSSESFSVRAQIDRLLERMGTGRALDLVDDLLALSCRAEAIAAFLAILGARQAAADPVSGGRRWHSHRAHRARSQCARARRNHRMSTVSELEMRSVLEAILFVAPQPVPRDKLLEVFSRSDREAAEEALEDVLSRYRGGEDLDGRGVVVDEAAGGLRLITRPELHGYLKKFFDLSGSNRLTMAALETLAIVAYRQPITAPEIQELRGKNSSGVLKTLLERRLIRISGRKEVVGKPFLYATTRDFLLHFGLNRIKDLPPLEEFEEAFTGDGGFGSTESLADGGIDREEEVFRQLALVEDAAGENGDDDDSVVEVSGHERSSTKHSPETSVETRSGERELDDLRSEDGGED